ncbi:hypothetical protein BCR34DRAFT_604326 [Clohesyomyces aquaticus]|uniref:Uncharacterized protein n=1 Tax=Clohesyomyces aquaticus TaxID=1231657 RepID=A0A1Y1Z6U4_9PLEO|nr:hypothetical protein BCR34DRAFT_604326 [Clohesyomyces aquaticus]
MTSGTVASILVLFLSCSLYIPVSAQQQAQFNQVLNLNGDMAINSFTFPDNTKIEAFSQSQRQLIVNQNSNPVSASEVTGSTGQPFVALMQQSVTISTNGATDLVGAQIELPIDPNMLKQQAVNPDNTFVGMLSPDRQSWMIIEPMRSVNITDNTVRMIKRNNIDGEYMALGRQTVETNAALTPFGSGSAQSVVIAGSGLQEAEYVDGFRMSVKASQPLTMNVDVKNGIETGMLTALPGAMSINDFRYLATTSLAGVQPSLNRMVTVVQLPINAVRLQQMMQQMGVQPNGAVQITVAQRGVLQNPGGATGQLQGIGQAAPAPATLQRRARHLFRRQTAQAAAAAAQAPAAQAAAPAAGAAVPAAAAPPAVASVAAPSAQAPVASAAAAAPAAQSSAPAVAAPAAAPAANGQTPPPATNGQNPPPPTQPQLGNPVATQLLLQPTFTPIQANAIFDPLNGRVAVPVPQVDGEYILVMSAMGAAGQQPQAQGQGQGQLQGQGQQGQGQLQGQGQQGQGQLQGEGQQAPKPAGTEPLSSATAVSSASASLSPTSASASEPSKASEPASLPSTSLSPKPTNSTTPIANEPKKAAEKRQQGPSEGHPGLGSIIMTMEQVNKMVDAQLWGGYAPVTKMMSEYVKANTK